MYNTEAYYVHLQGDKINISEKKVRYNFWEKNISAIIPEDKKSEITSELSQKSTNTGYDVWLCSNR